MNTGNTRLETKFQLQAKRYILLAFSFLIGILLATNVQAQQTLTWTDSGGGIFDISSNWNPVGVPGSADTARFIQLTFGTVPIDFYENEAVDEISFEAGNFLFQGAGNLGNGRMLLETQDMTMLHAANLVLQHGLDDRSFHLDVSDRFDIEGRIVVSEGTKLTTLDATLDSIISNSPGEIVLVGTDSNGDSSDWTARTVRVGDSRFGSLKATQGATMYLDDAIVGYDIGSEGTLVVDGESLDGVLSQAIVEDFAIIGRYGEGSLEILDGATFTTPILSLGAFMESSSSLLVSGESSSQSPSRCDVDVMIANQSTIVVDENAILTSRVANINSGSVSLVNRETTWLSSEMLTVGRDGETNFNVDRGATLSVDDAVLGVEQGSVGRINLAGLGNSERSRLDVSGSIYVGGNEAESGGEGEVTLTEYCEMNVGRTIKIWNDGVVELNWRTELSADQIDNSEGGEFRFLGGTLVVNRFEGNLTQTGSLLPGGNDPGSTFILGDYIQEPGSKLILDIGGTTAGIEHDLVNLSGVAFLGGQVAFRMVDGFIPSPTDEFIVLDASDLIGFIAGVVDGQRVETTDGSGSFIVNYGIGSAYGENRIVLTDYQHIGGTDIDVTPNSMTVVRGNHAAGTAANLVASDNQDVSIQRRNTDIQSRTLLEVSGTSPTPNPNSIKVTLEGSVFARTTVTQIVQLYNYNNDSWEIVDSRNARRLIDSVVEISPNGDVSRFVQTGSREMKARILYRSSNARQQFSSNTDQFLWTVEL